MTTSSIRLAAILVLFRFTLDVDVARAQGTAPNMNNVSPSASMIPGAQPDSDRPSTGETPLPQPAAGGPPGSGPDTQLGPVRPEDVKLIGSLIPPNGLTDWAASQRLRFFGWVAGGYTGSSTGSGLLELAPLMNRFGNTGLLNQAALVLERTLAPEWSWGFRAEFYMGSDAAFLRPVNGFGPTGDKFGTDFRQAYVSLHAPVLTEGGVDFKFGRQYVPIGFETTMAPYRPGYSLAYSWAYAENGATTGAIATIHVNPRLDVNAGITLGANSLFELQGRAPDYILRALYWLDADKRTKLWVTIYTGPKPLAFHEEHVGLWQTLTELQLTYDMNRWLRLQSNTNLGWLTQDRANHDNTSQWYGTNLEGIIHAHRLLDVNLRAEWFDDVDGARTGTRAHYFEITAGLNIMLTRWLNLRPEVRWDNATSAVFGPTDSPSRESHQWTYGFDTLVKF